MTTRDVEQSHHAALIRRFYDEVWNCNDERIARDLLHPELQFRGPSGPVRPGVDGFIEYLRAVHRAMGSYTCRIRKLIGMEDGLTALMEYAGIHREVFYGVPPTHQRITWTGTAVFQIRDGRISRFVVLGDARAMRQKMRTASETFARQG